MKTTIVGSLVVVALLAVATFLYNAQRGDEALVDSTIVEEVLPAEVIEPSASHVVTEEQISEAVQLIDRRADFVKGRPDIYRDAGWGDKSNPLHYDSDDILIQRALGGDGHAAWHLAMRSGSRSKIQDGKYHAVEAVVLLDSGEPLVFFIENFMTKEGEGEKALPYLLYAQQVGIEQTELAEGYMRIWNVDDAMIARVQDEVSVIREIANDIRADQGGS